MLSTGTEQGIGSDSKNANVLYRQEAFDAKSSQWLESVSLAMPTPYRFITIASSVAIAAILCLLVFGRFTRHETVSGELVPALGLLSTTAPSAGTISRMLVSEGEPVTQGSALIEFSTELNSLEIGKTRSVISEELRVQLANNEKALAAKDRLNEQKDKGLRQQISNFHRQLQEFDAQINIQAQQVKSAELLLEKIKPLEVGGTISSFQVEQQKSAALSAQLALADLRHRRTDIEQQIGIQQDLLSQLPFSAEAERVDLQRKIGDLEQALAQNESQRAVVLSSAKSGVISGIAVKEGQAVVAGQRLLSIIPQESPLQAELWLTSSAIGLVSTGDRVVLRYSAFPYQKYGQQYGTVSDVARSATGVSELNTIRGGNAEEPAYRVMVDLDEQAIPDAGDHRALKPGMALSASIILDHRRLYELILGSWFGASTSTRKAIDK